MPGPSAKRARITLFIERVKLIQKEQSNEFPFLINGKLPSERSRAYLFDKLREGLKLEKLCIRIARLSQKEFEELCECLGDNRSIRILALSKEGENCLEMQHLEDNWQSELLAAIKKNGRITTVNMPGTSEEFANKLAEVAAFNELKYSLGSYQATKASRPFPKDEIMRNELQTLMKQRHRIRIAGSLPPADMLCVLEANKRVKFVLAKTDSLTGVVADYLLNLYRDNVGELSGLEKVVCDDKGKQRLLREYEKMGIWKKECADKQALSCVDWPKTVEVQRKYQEYVGQCTNIHTLLLVSEIESKFLKILLETLKGKGLKHIQVHQNNCLSQVASKVLYESIGEHPDLESVVGVTKEEELRVLERLSVNRCLSVIRKSNPSQTLSLPCFPKNLGDQARVLEALFSASWKALDVIGLKEEHVKCIVTYSVKRKKIPALAQFYDEKRQVWEGAKLKFVCETKTAYVTNQREDVYPLFIPSDSVFLAAAIDALISQKCSVKFLRYIGQSPLEVIAVLQEHVKTCGIQSFTIDVGSTIEGYHERVCAFLKACPSLINLRLSFVTCMSANKRPEQYEKIFPLIAEVIAKSNSLSEVDVCPTLCGKPLNSIVQAVSISHTIEKLVLRIRSESYCDGLASLARLIGNRSNIHTVDLSKSPVYKSNKSGKHEDHPGILRDSMASLIARLKENRSIVAFKINEKQLEKWGKYGKKEQQPAYTKSDVLTPKNRKEVNNKDRAFAYLQAVSQKELGQVKDHLEKKGVSLYVRDDDGDSALHIAIRAGSAQMVDFMMQRGFNTAITGKDDLTPMELLDQLSREEPSKQSKYDAIRSVLLKQRKPRTAPKKKSAQKKRPVGIRGFFQKASQEASLATSAPIPAASGMSTEKYQLWEQVILGEIDPRILDSENIRTDPFNQSKTLFHALCQRPIVESKVRLLSSLIELDPDSARRGDKFGYSPLYALASIEATNDEEARVAEYMAMHLLRAGADPREAVTDVIRGHQMPALHRAILSNNYRLAKMIIKIYLEEGGKASELLNATNQLGQTAIHLAAAHINEAFLSYFLVFPGIQLNVSDMLNRKPDEITTDSDRKAALQAYRLSYQPNVIGVCWPKSFDAVRWSGTPIPGDGIQAQLQQKCEKSGQRGNPVTAKVSFVVKQPASSSREVVSILIDEQFVPKFHLADFVPTESFCQAAVDRAKNVPSDVVIEAEGAEPDPQLKSLTADDIAITFKENQASFKRLFHHGEESLVTALEGSEFHQWLLEQFRRRVSSGTKVYAAVVDAYSKYYVCANCQIALLGERIFITDFSRLLTENGFKVSKLGYFSFLIRVGAGFHWKIHKKVQSDHHDYRLDLRSRPRQFLQRDLSAQKATSFNSSRYSSNR